MELVVETQRVLQPDEYFQALEAIVSYFKLNPHMIFKTLEVRQFKPEH